MLNLCLTLLLVLSEMHSLLRVPMETVHTGSPTDNIDVLRDSFF